MASANYRPIPGSERIIPPDAVLVGPCPGDTQAQVTVFVRRANQAEFDERVAQLSRGEPIPPLTPEQFAQKFGADLQDITLVEAFAQAHNLTVTSADPVTRQVKITGTVANLQRAFAVQLHNYRMGGAEYRLRQGPVSIPAQLQNVIIGVFGLDNRPQAETHFRLAPDAATDLSSFNPTQVAALYQFPTGVTGAGETIGIIELGGGYQDSDITAYFQSLGIPAPTVVAVAVDGAQNTPTGDPNSADGEVLLDIEVAGAIAPGANQKVFFAPNTDQGFIDAVTTAVHDTAVTLVSISWGQAEDNFTDQSRTAFNQAFQEASTLGKTVFVASGDNGSTDGLTDGQNHVDFPASAPFAVGCGGTTLHASTSTIDSEVVWNELAQNEGATGGGVSRFFPVPDYQANANVPPNVDTSSPGRGVPDVAADADPTTGYNVLIDGTQTVVGGTSAVAPLYAGLFALINQALQQQNQPRAGYIQPRLYPNESAFNDITQGNNGAYAAGPGWDATTGLGTPKGQALLAALEGAGTALG